MSAATTLYRWLIRLLPKPIRERDGEEMLHTLQLQVAHSSHAGATTWRALRRFPAVLALEWRDALLAGPIPAQPVHSKGNNMDSFARILRQGAKSLLRTPAFSLSVVLLLGLGVGSVSAIFAIVDNVMLRAMPYPSAERIFVVQNGSHSVPTFNELGAMKSVEAWSAASGDEANLTGEGKPLRVKYAVVTDGFFSMFGARPQLGRLFQPSDFQAAETVVLAYGAWVRLFGGDTAIIGKTVHINDRALTIVGVMDGKFAVPDALVDPTVDLWRPLDPAGEYMNNRDYYAFSIAGRLRTGVALTTASKEAERVAAERAKAFPEKYVDKGHISELPLSALQERTAAEVKDALTLLFVAVVVLLLVACANVTHLFLARGVTRVREMAVRRALGARTRSLVAQLLTESVLLGTAGAVIGIGIAYAGVHSFLALMPNELPRSASIAVDARVSLFAAGVGILTAVVFGLLPALRFTRQSLGDPLRSSGRNATGGRAAQAFRTAIVVGEVALSLVLVAQAGWLFRSFVRMTQQDLGFRTAGVMTIPLAASSGPNQAGMFQRMDAVRESLVRTPGVKDVAFGLTMPLEWAGGSRCCWGNRPSFVGKEKPAQPSMYHPITDNYFRVLNIRIIAGTDWSRSRAEMKPSPLVINEVLAKQVFGSPAAAIGASLNMGKESYQVVGVAANNLHYGADQPIGGALYLPANAVPSALGRVTMAVLTDRTDAKVQADLRAAIWRVEPNVPVPVVRSLEDWARVDAAKRRFDSLLFGTFSAIALLLVAGGLAGTLFYMVSLQRRNLGIRLALGATPGGLERRVMTRGLAMTAAGASIGGVGAWLVGRFIESKLFGVNARDVGTLAIAVGVLMLIALVSSWIPARRAASTNPMECMRVE